MVESQTMDQAAIDLRAAFDRVARSELPHLYSLARHLDPDAAEDLVQECLLRAFRSFDSLRDREAAGGWLRVILTNVWRDHLRKSARSPREVPIDDLADFSLFRTLIDEDPFPYSDSLHLDFLGAFTLEDVHAVLQRLPARYRTPLVLRYVEGMSTKQIAAALEMPLGTVLSQLHRGRKLFECEMWRYAEQAGVLERASKPRSERAQEVRST